MFQTQTNNTQTYGSYPYEVDTSVDATSVDATSVDGNQDQYEEDQVQKYNTQLPEMEFEDSFSDVDDDVDDYDDKPRIIIDSDSEEEFSEDEDESDEPITEEEKRVKHAIYMKLENKKAAKQLAGLSVLEGKLNWVTHEVEEIYTIDLDDNDFPDLSPPRTREISPQETDSSGSGSVNTKIRSTNFANKPKRSANYIVQFVGRRPERHAAILFERLYLMTRTRLCKYIAAGESCRFGNNCIFPHSLPKTTKPYCRYGQNCTNSRCTFQHGTRKHESPKQRVSRITGNALPAPALMSLTVPKQTNEKDNSRKMRLCKNIFTITSEELTETGICKFGETCIYAHTKEELRQNIEECRFGENCKSVDLVFKKKSDGKKVRRYENTSGRKCHRLHTKERVIDYIKRTQAQPHIQAHPLKQS